MTTQHSSFPQHNITRGSHYAPLSALNPPPRTSKRHSGAGSTEVKPPLGAPCQTQAPALSTVRYTIKFTQTTSCGSTLLHTVHAEEMMACTLMVWLVRERQRSQVCCAPAAWKWTIFVPFLEYSTRTEKISSFGQTAVVLYCCHYEKNKSLLNMRKCSFSFYSII